MSIKTLTKAVYTFSALAVIVGQFALQVRIASAWSTDSTLKKAYVCKYVSKPGEQEKLQTGDNPIGVDNKDYSLGDSFTDKQVRSVVIGFYNPNDKDNIEPTIADCKAPVVQPQQPNMPTFDDMSCDVNDTVGYTIPNDANFYFTVQINNGVETKTTTGYHALARVNQNVTIRAYANGGDTTKAELTKSHTFVFPECPVGNGGGQPTDTTVPQTPVTPTGTGAAATTTSSNLSTQAAELPHTGPAANATAAMSLVVFPTVAYGLTYLIRQRFGL